MTDSDALRKAFFNERAGNWLEKNYKGTGTDRYDLHADKIGKIVASLELERDSRVLDVGCGSGVLVPYLLAHVSSEGRVFEMDYAKEMINENKRIHQDSRISFICSDVTEMPFGPAELSAVICFACFPHFQHPRKALERIGDSLVPGGRLTIAHLMSSDEIADHHTSNTPVCRDRLPSRDRMEEMVREGGLTITSFEDRPGLYQLCAVKQP